MNQKIEKFKNTPIPNLDDIRNQKFGYRDLPIKPEDDDVVDLLTLGIAGENYYFNFKLDDGGRVLGAIPNLFARKTVADKLVKINQELKPAGVELFVRDTYRPPEVQKFMHDEWAPHHFKKLHQDWSEEKIKNEVNNFWAYVNKNGTWEVDPKSPPPHTTGAAVDLTLCKIGSKEFLNMGAKFDEMEESVFTDFLEKLEIEDSEQIEFRENRRLLYWVMLGEGFVNNPTEWWHYSFGDQMWATLSHKPYAVYSNISIQK
ncbi:MAG: M15 family metallopeptidase [Patescibacteria group bacterium]|jgi:D-alanyl-D-alanine dipeptidase